MSDNDQADAWRDDRLSRIEQKIDKLSDAMINLARAEEKLIGIESSNVSQHLRMNRLSEKIDLLETKTDESHRAVKILYGIMYVILTAALGTMFKLLTMPTIIS
tara:strand:- start:8636 stop:8947 length:312 start_codon:yes stop_codon:yes gene_type:complete